MAFNIVYNYQANDRFSAVSRKINKALDNNKKKIESINKQLRATGKGFKDLGTKGLAKVTAPIALVGGFALKSAADLETMQVSFESMLGSEEKATKLTKDLIKFAATTPFQLEGIGQATKQLLAFGVTQEELTGKDGKGGKLKFLGDIAAGANIPLKDMAAIFGKSKAKGKAMTEELLQLSDRGVPVIDTLAAGLRISKAEVFELAQKGKISFSILEKAMMHMTKEGNIFYDQMNKQSKTLSGRFSTLKDVSTNALAALGNEIVTVFDVKENIRALSEWIEKLMISFQNLSPATKKWLLIGVAIAAVLPPIIFAIGAMITMLPILVTGFSAVVVPVVLLAKAMGVLLLVFKGIVTIVAILGGPITALILLVTALGALGVSMYNHWKPFRDLIDSIVAKAAAVGGIGKQIFSGDFTGAKDSALKLLNGSDVSNAQNSKASVDVNLNAPEGVVKSVEGKSDGPLNLNTGSNVR